MKKIVKTVCFVLLCCLLAQYSVRIIGTDDQYHFLARAWESTFTKFNAKCIHWIGMRVTIWIYVYLIMMRLENSFTIYLFIRQRNFMKLFIRMYARCLRSVMLYYGLAMIIMAICFHITLQEESFWQLLFQNDILIIYTRECAASLNFCLTAYFIYCLIKRMELGFLVTLGSRLLLFIFMNGLNIPIITELFINVILTGIVLYYAAHNFAERIKGEV